MAEYIVKVHSITKLTHNVKSFKVEKPEGYTFAAGQAAEVAINTVKWVDEVRPFTFTGLPTDIDLEFTIKSYRDRAGVTHEFDKLKRDSELVIGDPWGNMEYRGPGIFLAGGAGITPFLAIFRQLAAQGLLNGNRLVWANTTEHDFFHDKELRQLLGSNFVPVIGHPKSSVLKKIIKPATDWAYICGPEGFEEAMVDMVTEFGIPTTRILQEE